MAGKLIVIMVVVILSFNKMEICISEEFVHTRDHDPVEQYHTPEGCVPFEALIRFLKSDRMIHPTIRTPEWCDLRMTPKYLENLPPQKSPPPFSILTFQYSSSNAIKVTINVTENGTFIGAVYMMARFYKPWKKESVWGRRIGRFLPEENTKIVCCNYLDRNAVKIVIPEDETMSSAHITWIPDGDEGSFCFLVTFVNTRGEYWPAVASNVTIANV